MAAVEYGECPSIHTSGLARFEYGIRVLEVYFFSPDLNWNVLRTQILASKYGQYGYWNTAGRSAVWSHFKLVNDDKDAKCTICGSILKYNN